MGSLRKDVKRVDDFIRDAEVYNPKVCVPDPSRDYGMYSKMDEAFKGLHGHLDELRRNQGRVGYSAQNLMSDLSKDYISAAQQGDQENMAYIGRAMEMLTEGFNEASADGALAESGNRFGRTIWQEQMEAELFGKIWPVITGAEEAVPDLLLWGNFHGNVQAYLYGFLDVVSELSKALAEEFSKPDMTVEKEFATFERYLAIADSITLRLSHERHTPGYIISNGYGHWMAYSNKLRTAYGTIAFVRRDYNLRRSIQRMVAKALKG
ncbi:MAG: hypothetical protein A3G49_05700 [Candidatus Sungbacteria bacterium RIFCSPLOWO2_12_FULL_41_11]|uniref:Uncharacterized protein n=1 Tax=Candidatus Sungbacteria bacterium RIFCSPLOWO2_12_FULL_41_11 TaxID=1802286 RepID=A0A1G2LSM1_9BACT|nr:MAG: hypothetical protein UV01_C0008G0017 [Parcubacteria group bacterium GW2011_GWA2_42_14]OGZ99214.1 MAG: hypothetical protein A3D41_02860 [Candidatus Sungbacteria bacterium RIFCSPHIGHO2_02_FULL_41_12b]OHA14645.1 MAG: hypothetical protein A3G49_05700 [Candidatus Sungbacteria bacterium RIFCSPLOWO2_12_FULL_41_11]